MFPSPRIAKGANPMQYGTRVHPIEHSQQADTAVRTRRSPKSSPTLFYRTLALAQPTALHSAWSEAPDESNGFPEPDGKWPACYAGLMVMSALHSLTQLRFIREA